MLVSYNWLNSKYFNNQLPEPEKLSEALTFHAWEMEDIYKVGNDTVLDIKVLPDKSMWAFSHRGIAKDISVILNLPLSKDPLETAPELTPSADIGIRIDSATCRRFAAARLEGVKVGPSPAWLKEALEAIGQRSINNIVDASNYVMFDIGQPSHAFDAGLVGKDGFRIRLAEEGETLVGLDEKEYTFDSSDTLVTRADNNEILSIGGLKGGMHSGISEQTTDIIVEAANWDPVAIRKTGQRLKLRTDASARYENGVVPELIPYGLKAVVDLILEIAGGTLVGFEDVNNQGNPREIKTVEVTLEKINSLLGLKMTADEVAAIMDRFSWQYELNGQTFAVTSPFERTDINIPEDLIEEIGRIYGYEHVQAVTPEPMPLTEINKRFYYGEVIRTVLTEQGFSEIYTSSFRQSDKIALANALASDKGYLRSSLLTNMDEALAKNIPNADLLGVRQIRLFEIGTVFDEKGESWQLALGVRSPSGFKAKSDDPVIASAVAALSEKLGIKFDGVPQNGLIEIDLGTILEQLPLPSQYESFEPLPPITYKPFSSYPAIARDIAMWVSEGSNIKTIEGLIKEAAGDLCVRISLFDEFTKDGRTSYAFRLVFQAPDRTLTDDEANSFMNSVYEVAKNQGWEVR